MNRTRRGYGSAEAAGFGLLTAAGPEVGLNGAIRPAAVSAPERGDEAPRRFEATGASGPEEAH